jgi:hypothetical protein
MRRKKAKLTILTAILIVFLFAVGCHEKPVAAAPPPAAVSALFN